MLTPDDAKIIASRGGGMILDAAKFTPEDLKIIASRASGGGIIILRNASRLLADDAKIIASRGKGRIILDFT